MIHSIEKEVLNWQAFLKHKAQLAQDQRLKAFYQVGTYSEDTLISEAEFVALDFETTGLDANQNSIISIGLVPFDLKRIYCKRSKHWLIRPQDKLQEDSIVIHGITHSDLQGAPDLRRILDEVLTELAGKVVVVHYRRIERDFFDTNLRALINEGIVFPLIDTMQIEANVQHSQRSFINKLIGNNKISLRLAHSRDRYNLPTYTAHDALIDAIATAELFQAQSRYHFKPSTQLRELWL